MAAPVCDIRINFDGLGLNRIDNDGFETNTTGWSVTAGIQAAGSSITRTTGGSPWMGVAVGRLVTTSTNGSGVKFVMSSTFLSGSAYRFRVYLKSVSGATTCGIRIGSLGTAGDRAVSTFTVTTTWTAYTVDFTPTGNRTDIQVNVYTNSAAAMTVDIDAAEVYRVTDDVTQYCDEFSFDHGVNFEGGLLSGSATLSLNNDASPALGGSGLFGGPFTDVGGYGVFRVIRQNMAVYIRATYLGIPYALFYGRVKRLTADPTTRKVSVSVADPVDAWSRSAEVSIPTSVTRTLAAFRGLILDALGEPAARRSLSTGEDEGNIPATGADQADALDLLGDIDTSTGTLSYLNFNPSTSVLFVYTTIARNASVFTSSLETIGTDTPDAAGQKDFTEYSYDDDESANLTDVRVNYTTRALQPAETLWTSPDIPFTVPASTTVTVWADFSDPVVSASVGYTATNTPTVTLTAFFDTAKIVITAGGTAAVVSDLYVTGQPLEGTTQSVTYSSGATPPVLAPAVSGDFVQNTASALALAQWYVTSRNGGSGFPHATGTVENLFPTQLVRKITDPLAIRLTKVDSSLRNYLIRSISTSVSLGSLDWSTTFGLERFTAGVGLFVLDASHLDSGSDGFLGL